MKETDTIQPQEFLLKAQNLGSPVETETPLASTLRAAIHTVHDAAARSEFTVYDVAIVSPFD